MPAERDQSFSTGPRRGKPLGNLGSGTDNDPSYSRLDPELDVPRRRVPIDFSPEAFERLVWLQAHSDAATKAEVIRRSLQLFEWLVIKGEEGWESLSLSRGTETYGPVDLGLIMPSVTARARKR